MTYVYVHVHISVHIHTAQSLRGSCLHCVGTQSRDHNCTLYTSQTVFHICACTYETVESGSQTNCTLGKCM